MLLLLLLYALCTNAVHPVHATVSMSTLNEYCNDTTSLHNFTAAAAEAANRILSCYNLLCRDFAILCFALLLLDCCVWGNFQTCIAVRTVQLAKKSETAWSACLIVSYICSFIWLYYTIINWQS